MLKLIALGDMTESDSTWKYTEVVPYVLSPLEIKSEYIKGKCGLSLWIQESGSCWGFLCILWHALWSWHTVGIDDHTWQSLFWRDTLAENAGVIRGMGVAVWKVVITYWLLRDVDIGRRKQPGDNFSHQLLELQSGRRLGSSIFP